MFQPLTLGRYALQEYGFDWGYAEVQHRLLPGQVYGLHFGADSRRFLYVGEPDSAGEYPVLVLDTDDIPYTAIMYPGIDVYLAHNAGVVRYRLDTYESFATHPCYAARIHEHARHYFGGRVGFEIFELDEIAPS